MLTLIIILNQVLSIYVWIVIAAVILSWLVNFNVVNPYNPAIRAIQNICYTLTEPLLGPIRRLMPDLGGLDISPIVLIFGIELLRQFAFSALL